MIMFHPDTQLMLADRHRQDLIEQTHGRRSEKAVIPPPPANFHTLAYYRYRLRTILHLGGHTFKPKSPLAHVR